MSKKVKLTRMGRDSRFSTFLSEFRRFRLNRVGVIVLYLRLWTEFLKFIDGSEKVLKRRKIVRETPRMKTDEKGPKITFKHVFG